MKKIVLSLVLILVQALIALAGDGEGKTVLVLPIEREIDMQAVHHVRSGLREARECGASLVLVKLNTFGGALDAADSIRAALRRCPVGTVAFVDPNSASAGALIALACDSVWMSPEASMGSATVVNGAGEPMPEKYQQYMRAMMRATAESHGLRPDGDSGAMVARRNPEIADRMVKPDESISLTATQAVAEGYAEGIAPNVEAVLEQLHMADARVVMYEPSMSDNILGFLSNAAVRAVLVTLILGALYMEMHSPGLGFAAAVAMVATVLFFLPMIVTGALSAWVIVCFILGIVLVALEIFVIPGFGICGVAGGIAILASLGGAIMESDAVTGFDFGGLVDAFFTILAGLVMAIAGAVWLTGKHGPKFIRRHTELMTELKTSEGFVGVDMGMAKYVGEEARAHTDLRPAGKITIGDEILPAVSAGEYISKGAHLRVVKFENAQLVVEKK
ncbi:MAG: nodulation protein NfeD [Muribaculaceae bacterium]|nr:nodulation protein NfeD [Muribaculaceae bacterium]